MKIAIVGTGYVGLVAGACFADSGHNVFCVDLDEAKLAQLRDGKTPIYEPGLEDVLRRARSRMVFTSDLQLAVQQNDIIFVAVGTPETADGSADMGPTHSVVKDICRFADGPKYIVLKSTVPVGTAKKLSRVYGSEAKHPIEFISNPEFLREGAAIDDFLKPDRVIVGCQSQEAHDVMTEVYKPFVSDQCPIHFMDNTSAEMTKYAANAFLSVKISFINELALLADQMGANIDSVRLGFTCDHRINPAFFNAGIGFGGSCFPKDVKALVHTGNAHGVPMRVVQAADEVNNKQKLILFDRVLAYFKNLENRTIAVWGLSFKPNTDDVREAPALKIIEQLTAHGARVVAYDPVAGPNAQKVCQARFELTDSALKAAHGADALLIATEWNEFHNPDFTALKAQLKNPVIFDGRNLYSPEKMKSLNFVYFGIGRQSATTAVESESTQVKAKSDLQAMPLAEKGWA